MSDLWDFAKFIAAVMAGVALLIVATLLLVVLPMERQTCASQAAVMGLPHQFGFWQGCMVHTAAGWVPLDNVRVVLH